MQAKKQSTKQFLIENIQYLDQAALHPKYKKIVREYVSGVPSSELCIEYNIKKSRIHSILRTAVLSIKNFLEIQ